MNTLHILNGDSTLEMFKKADIDGTTLVWREVLCDGPVSYSIGTEKFWGQRRDFMNKEFDVEAREYIDKTKNEWDKLDESEWDEIVLWFEYDLFCQWNMMALLSFFNEYPPPKISLICVGDELGTDHNVGLAEIAINMYASLIESRQTLSEASLHFASLFWNAYQEGDFERLHELFDTPIPSVFKYLEKAAGLFYSQFPHKRSGIGIIEFRILEWVKSGVDTESQLVGKLLREDWDFGFGDTQYFKAIRLMKELLEIKNEKIQLSSLGEGIYSNEIEYAGNMYHRAYLGGFEKSNFLYDPKEKQLILR